MSGLAPNEAVARILVAFQGYFDESIGDDVFVLGGYIATAEEWASFSTEWQEMLQYGIRSEDGRDYFKMKEMAESESRMNAVPGFYRIIEHHARLAVSCSYRPSDLEKAQQRIYISDALIDWGFINNKYLFGTRCLLDMFHTNKEKLAAFIPTDAAVDFIFDNRSDKGGILSVWTDYMSKRPADIRPRYGATPRFEVDKECLPLQAADLWAWWIRKWIKDGKGFEDKLKYPDFGSWRGKRDDVGRVHISFDEDQLVEGLISMAKDLIQPGSVIYDLGAG